MELVRLGPEHVRRTIAGIDRSEHVDLAYAVVDGELVSRPTTAAESAIARWDEQGVAERVAHWEPVVAAGAAMFVALDGDEIAGVVIVDPLFEPPMAWLALLHVSRPHRRSGVGSALWAMAETVARDAGATSMYVSAMPSGSAVGFYLSRGCRLADPPHAALFAEEPEDVHLVCPLG